MGANSKIEWCRHTFNPWVGCTPVSAACDFCYAESWAKRAGHPELWHGERRRTTAANWREPLKWDRAAAAAGERHRVFCASLADVFDNQVPKEWRHDLWVLIASTPHLDWLLLTKRPQNIAKMLPVMNSRQPGYKPWNERWPWSNVWLGTTAEDQEHYDQRWPHLREIPAKVRFISYEPALGPIHHLSIDGCASVNGKPRTPDWIIAGGESGGQARLPHPQWFRDLRDECIDLGIAFLFKQWGEWRPHADDYPRNADRAGIVFPDGSFRARGLGDATGAGGADMFRAGKKAAGRLLDGRTWDEFPRLA